MSESDWKKRVGIQINYSPGHSSDDEDNLRAENGKRNEMGLTRFEHMRGPSEHLLNDGEDVSPADLLGTTPPRLRIRNKEKKRTNLENDVALRRLMRVARRNTVDNFFSANIVTAADIIDGPGRKRSSLKLLRGKERDMKLDIGEARGYRTESLPSPGIDLVASRKPAIPTLVESCSRFMSLSSKLKCASFKMKGEAEDCLQQAACHMELEPEVDERVPANRIHFHKTFSMLIKMGSIDKGCRRTISVEEQVWQNELKDLIWLEIRAKLAGRTLQQQDCILCSQRNIVPTIIQNIINYRFSETKCFGKFGATSPAISSRSSDGYGSDDSLSHVEHEDYSLNTNPKLETINENVPGSEAKCHQIPDHQSFGCLCFNCDPCSNTVGKALKEVRTLLDSFCNAESLYPSSKAMAIHHPLIATQLFNNRLKALCLWYNMAYHVRLKILIIRKMINMLKKKTLEKQRRYETNDSENRDPTQTDASKPPLVRFSGTSCDSNNSDLDPKSSHDETDHTVMLSRKISTETMDSSKPSSGTTSDSNKSCPKSNDKYGSNDSNGTSSTVSSTESGFGSDDHKIRNQAEPAEADDMSHKYVHGHDVFNIGSLSELTQLKLLGNCKVSPYRQYIEEVLKTKGLRKALNFLEKMHLNVLQRAHMTFQKYDSSKQYTDESGEVMEEAETESKEKEEEPAEPTEGSKNCMELRRYGCWSEETMQMRLPSYRSSFLFLCTICVEVCHEYLDMRLETKPEKPSILSIKQLIQEVKEGLDIASIERSRFVRNVDTAICGYTNSTDAKNYLGRIIQKFDDTVERVFKHYLGYLTAWSDMEHIPRNVLEAEWTFTANLAKRIKCAAMLTPITFANIVTLQLEKVTLRFNEKFATLDSSLADYDSDSNSASDDEDRLDHIRRLALAQCREAQQIFSTERELIIQTAHFSRLLSGRLRKNSLFAPSRTKLYHAMMEARDSIFKWINIVTNRSNSKYLRDLGESYDNSLTIRTKEVLLHGYKFGFEFHRELYKFAYHHQPKVMPNPMVPVRERPSSVIEYRPARRERSRRPGTVMGGEVVNVALVNNRSFHRELHKFVNEPPCARTAPTGVARPLRPAPPPPCAPVPPPRRPKFMRSDSVGGDAYNKAVFEDIAPTFNTMTSIEYSVPDIAFEGEELLFKQCSIDEQECLSNARKLPSKLEEVVTRKRLSVTGNEDSEWAVAVSRAIIEFAKHWMSFVMDRCDRGRGLRPRWANHGLEFLMLACDPCNTRHLTEAEFESLKGVMDDCISHVIGSTVPATSPAALLPSPPAHGTPPPQRRARHARHYHHPLVQLQNKHKDVPTPPTPPSEPQLVVIFDNQEETSHSERVAAAIAALDETRDLERQERGVVGRPLNRGATPASAEPLPRQVTFRWQRGIKIGAGRFGKVYTVVNTESGQLLAMKEVSLGPGDRRAVQKAANELRVLEGVLHPNLVRYYGCEIHREEMLIFMELCMEGSLEALVAECAGLPEQQVRRYAQQLLSAIAELHDRKIAHRDIKSGNIFLTNEGHCLKLGDFGCAVKIRANTTVAGELQGYVGTQAYMAPEVFMKSSGHGRAADIWSYGCVVTEMASGKRPFSDYDSNYQIMFMVGMGGRPETPASLSAEGQEFCLQCLTHDPEERPRATELASHHFLKVKQECNCEVSYLIT